MLNCKDLSMAVLYSDLFYLRRANRLALEPVPAFEVIGRGRLHGAYYSMECVIWKDDTSIKNGGLAQPTQ